MNEIKHYLSQKVRETIENTFYHDINQPALWHQLFAEALEHKEDFSKKIETMATNGISNLHQFYTFCFTHFFTARQLFIKEILPFNKNLMEFYLSLLSYFSNCYDNTKKKTLFEMNKAEILEFFMQPDITAILQMIADKHPADMALLKTSHPTEILRKLLLLPYQLDENLVDTRTFKNPLDIGKKILGNEIPDEEVVFNVITTLYLFFFLKRLFYLCGSNKFFGFYQRLIDSESGNALYSIPYQSQMFLLKGTSSLVAGETNIDSIQLLPNGFLLVFLRHGLFSDDLTTSQAAFNTALALSEYLHDTLYLFNAFTDKRALNTDFVYHILIETPADNPHFIDIVLDQISHMYSELINIIRVIPALTHATPAERTRYLNANDISISSEFLKEISEKLTAAGHKTTLAIPEQGFAGIKMIELQPKDILFNEGDSSLFVYIPFSDGLKGHSIKTNIEFYPKAWAPIGHIGILQNDVRTATILAEQPVKLLMIPGSLYLRYWHADYSMEELRFRIHGVE